MEKNSNGRYVVDIYWYSSYASDVDPFQMIQDGETDFNFGAGMSSVDKRFAWQRIPFLLPDLDTVREKLANPNAEGFAINTKLYEENGIKLLAQNSGLQRHIFSTDKLIKVPKDLANETFRTYEDAIVDEFYGGLGKYRNYAIRRVIYFAAEWFDYGYGFSRYLHILLKIIMK